MASNMFDIHKLSSLKKLYLLFLYWFQIYVCHISSAVSKFAFVYKISSKLDDSNDFQNVDVNHFGFSWLGIWSPDLLRMRVIMPPHSKFHLNRTIWSRVIAPKNDFHYGVCLPSWICKFLISVTFPSPWSKFVSAYHISSNSDNSQMRYRDMTILKMAAVRPYIGFILSGILQLSCFTVLA